MQPGTVGLRGALIAAWEQDLRAVRQDGFDMGRGREALYFIQRFYGLISSLRAPIQRAWGAGGHVHVVDSPEIGGPGPRVSQSRIRLRNHGDEVMVELFSYAEGTSRANPPAGLDRSIRVADVEPLVFVTELYRTAVDFLSGALNLDLSLAGSAWLYEHASAIHFVEVGRWPSVGEAYRRATRELAVADSFESVMLMLKPSSETSSSNGSNGSTADGAEVRLSIEELQRYIEPLPDLENFIRLVHIALAADHEDTRVDSAAVAAELGLDSLALSKLGWLASVTPDVGREGSFAPDYSEWSFLPAYNVHLFRGVASGDLPGRAHGDPDRRSGRGRPRLPLACGQSLRETSPAGGGRSDPGVGDHVLDRRRHSARRHTSRVGREAPAGRARPA